MEGEEALLSDWWTNKLGGPVLSYTDCTSPLAATQIIPHF